MPLSRRNILLAVSGFSLFVFAQAKSGKSGRLYTGAETIKKIQYSDEEWHALLDPEAYQILREGHTERRYSSPLNNEWRAGKYYCKGCNLALFDASMKFDSRTGWPSFNSHIIGHLQTYTDLKAFPPQRAYRCARCGGHHGHLIMDGPLPTGERWCSNGAALRFIAT